MGNNFSLRVTKCSVFLSKIVNRAVISLDCIKVSVFAQKEAKLLKIPTYQSCFSAYVEFSLNQWDTKSAIRKAKQVTNRNFVVFFTFRFYEVGVMRNLLVVLFLSLVSPSTLACTYALSSIDIRYENADAVFTAIQKWTPSLTQ